MGRESIGGYYHVYERPEGWCFSRSERCKYYGNYIFNRELIVSSVCEKFFKNRRYTLHNPGNDLRSVIVAGWCDSRNLLL